MIFEMDESRCRIQADRDTYRAEYQTWSGTLAATGKLVGGDALETEHNTPATVRKTTDGASSVTDGPAHTSEETLGGWFVLEVADHAKAVELAKTLPTPETIEIRPLLESA
ncbi:YciI family protein [Streptomyces inhibens]|uniref:YciI family protein n=1 Tax=Streptomyces inhibens TaxID=2293571 RepID=UPI002479D06F|nr:YciI family protein [Streptomyces inhibens]UKY55036.1 YciI family protein [Streptomyces inhibens]